MIWFKLNFDSLFFTLTPTLISISILILTLILTIIWSIKIDFNLDKSYKKINCFNKDMVTKHKTKNFSPMNSIKQKTVIWMNLILVCIRNLEEKIHTIDYNIKRLCFGVCLLFISIEFDTSVRRVHLVLMLNYRWFCW